MPKETKKKTEMAEVMITAAFHDEGGIVKAGRKYEAHADKCAYLISEGKACALDDVAGCKAAKENAARAKMIGQPVARSGAMSEAEFENRLVAGVAAALKSMGIEPAQPEGA